MFVLGDWQVVGRSRASRSFGLLRNLGRQGRRSRAFIGTVLVLGVAFGTFAQPVAPVQAATPSCVSSSPVGNAYTVNACISAPADGATVTATQTVTATATVTGTNPGVARAVFFLRGAYLLTDTTSPYTFQLATTDFVDGTAVLEVEMNMRDGFASTHAPVTLTFSNGITTPPVNTNTFTPKTPAPAAGAGHPLIVTAAGDGASGEPNETVATNIIAGYNPDMVLYLGDVYEKGTLTEFKNWYGNSSTFYGQFKNKTNPVVGNHEYEGNQAPGYFNYWDNIPHYYSYNDAGWHFIALDSTSQYGQLTPGTPQFDWLQNDLRTNTQPCTLAYFHHPTFSIGPNGDTTRMNPIWSLFNTWGVDLVLNGHDHDYQRWLPLDANGNPSPTGVTEFVVGTGGHGVQNFVRTDGRVVKQIGTVPEGIGALKLALGDGSATYEFKNGSGVQDSGSISCTPSSSDQTPPTKPAGLSATPLGANRVDLNWQPATDNVGVVSYDLTRNDQFLCSVPGSATSYADTTAAPSTAYTYTIQARDLAGNSSPPSDPASATTPSGSGVPLFTDGFESGDLTGWTNAGMVVQNGEVSGGSFAARATTTTAADWAWHPITAQTNVYYRLKFNIVSQGANSVYLLKVRTATGTSIGGLYVDSSGRLSYRNDAGAATVVSPKTVTRGAWHEIQVHYVINGVTGQIETWLDGAKVTELSKTDNFGTTPIGRIQIADNSGTRAFDLAIDDVVVDTQFISGGATTDTAKPSVPGNLTASAVSSNKVDLSWNPSIDNVAVVAYDLFVDGEPLDSVPASSTTYSDTSVDPGTTYHYTVQARDAAGNSSDPSNTATVTPPATLPGTPTGLTATGGNAQVTLSWTAPASDGGSAITGYKIYRGTTTGGETFLKSVGNVTSTSDSGLTNGSTYFYKVTAVNTVGESGLSNEASATPTAAVTAPGAPTSVTATPGDTTVSVSWSPPTSNGGATISSYSVYRSTSSGGPFTTPVGTTSGTVTTFPDSGLSNGTTYFYEVSATNSVGEGALSSPAASATPAAGATVPGAPTALTANASPGKVALAWTAPASDGGSAITGYEIWRGTATGSEAKLTTTVGTGTTYDDTAVTNGNSYFYKVKAVNTIGASGFSNEASASVVGVPGAPTGLTATRGNNKVDLSWTAPTSNGGSPITEYKVYRSTTAGTESFLSTAGTATSFTDTTAVNGTMYFYKVTALNMAGESAKSNEASATPATNPGAPTLTATAGAGQVALSWTAAASNGSAVTAYKVYKGTASGGETLLTTLGNVLTYTDTAVTAGTPYFYKVSAVNGVGEGAVSTETSATPTAASAALFSDGFESGNLAGWTNTGMVVQSAEVSGGSFAARASTTTAADWAWHPITDQTSVYYRLKFKVVSQGANSVYLLKVRTATGTSIGGIYLDSTNRLSYRNDAGAATVVSSTTASRGAWHELQVHYAINGLSGQIETWLDGAQVAALSKTDNFGTTAIGRIQIADNSGSRAFDLAIDDVVVDTQFISGGPPVQPTTPGAPTSVTATPGNTTVTVSWSPPTSNGGATITGYTVYRSLTSGGTFASVGTTNASTTNLVDQGLSNGTTYFYKVSATNSVGEGPQSSPAASATPAAGATAPDAPTGLTATATPGKVALSWTAPASNGGSAITSYEIWRGTVTDGETKLTTPTVTGTTYDDMTVTNGTTYFYKVKAVNAVGPSGFSNEASAQPVAGPGAPTGLTATPGDTSVLLSWTAPTDNGGSAITGYKVYRSTTTGMEALLTTIGNVTTYNDTAVTNGTRYFYKVAAVNATATGTQSLEAAATPATTPSTPTLTATAGAGQVSLSWTAAATNGSALTQYKIYRGTASGGETALTTTPGNVTTYTDTSVIAGTTYWYEVSAVNGVGEGAQSAEKSATPTAAQPLLTEDFEAGNLATWTVTGPIAANGTTPRGGTWEARDLCAGSACWAWKSFGSQTATELWMTTYIYVQTRDTGTTTLLKLRNTSSGSGTSVFGLLLNNKGRLAYRNDVTAKTVATTTTFPTGGWHKITVHLTVATAGHVDVWVDGAPQAALSRDDNFGTTPIAKLQLGENASGGNFDVRFDDINVTKTSQTP